LAFHENETLDEEGLRRHFAELAASKASRVSRNGHTGEIVAASR
jgi:dihydrodipicolinate synthase/N-acetylneuraminate lyase